MEQKIASIMQHNRKHNRAPMSDGNICSNVPKYGGFGAMMANSFCVVRRSAPRTHMLTWFDPGWGTLLRFLVFLVLNLR
jgi:hypothetical protein